MALSHGGQGTAIYGPPVGGGNLAPQIPKMLQVPRLYGGLGLRGLGIKGLGV